MVNKFFRRLNDKIRTEEKYQNIMIRSLTLGLLILAIIALNVLSAMNDKAKVSVADEKAQTQLTNSQKPKYIAENDYWLESERTDSKSSDNKNVTDQDAKTRVAAPKKTEDGQNEEAVTAMSKGDFSIISPAEGSWTRSFGYSYDKTWQEYNFHNGVDMPLKLGKSVVAVADGEVLSINKDKNRGTVITIKHSNKLESVYVGLEPAKGLKQGDIVKAEDVVGTICQAPLFEEAEGSHLHFEIWKSGKAVDPLIYLQ